MNKKGQIVEVIGIVIIIGIVIFGSTKVYYQKNSLFVVDKIGNVTYPYSLCKEQISKLSEENLIVFQDLKSAKAQGYNNVTNC